MSDLISREYATAVFKKHQSHMATHLWEYEQDMNAIPSADIMECARAIKEHCRERMKKPIWCNDCPLYEKVCFLFGNVPIPCKWDLPEGEKGGNDDNN